MIGARYWTHSFDDCSQALRARGLDCTADELDGVGEVDRRQDAGDRALRGLVDVHEVLEHRRRDVQHLLDVFAAVVERGGDRGEMVERVPMLSRLSATKPRRSFTAPSRPCIASATSFGELVSTVVTSARFLLNAASRSLLEVSADTSNCSCARC